MTYIAELEIKVDSTQIESATQKVQELIQASKGLGNSPIAKPLPAPKQPAQPKPPKQPKPEVDDDKAYQKWFAMAEKRDKEERKFAQARNAILSQEIKSVTDAADARVKAEEKSAKAEEKRYNAVRSQQDTANKALYKSEAAELARREKVYSDSKATLKARADKAAQDEVNAGKLAQRELEKLDRLRLTGTLRRIKEESDAERAASQEEEARARKRASNLRRIESEFDPGSTELKRLDNRKAYLAQNSDGYTEAQLQRMNKNIDAAREKVLRYNNGLGRTALSAKQLQMAQMGLPAQFTDIVVSLQGGQAPLTVLLQQGGQIKDMFGGIGPALKGVASAVKPMINVYTMAAAALAALGVAYNQGSKETDAYRLALVSTGNAAGTTIATLASMANTVDGVVGTSAKAAGILSELAATGKIASGSFVDLTIAAVKWEKASGTAASETVKEFAKLGDDPVNAAIKLNEQVNFLTVSTYQQAAALVKQGRESEAATLLQNEYADSLTTRADEIIEKQGYVERAWYGIKSAAAEAWDAMLDIGRTNTLEDDLDDIVKKVNKRSAALNLFGGGFAAQEPGQEYNPNKEWTDRLDKEVQDMAEARKQMFANEDAKKAIQYHKEFSKDLLDNASKADKLTTAMDKLNKRVKFMREKGVIISDADVKKAQEGLKEKYKEPGGRKSADLDNTEANEIGNKINEIKAKYKTLDDAIKQQTESGTLSMEAAVAKRKALLADETAKLQATYGQQIAALEKLKKTKGISANQSVSLDRQIADARSKMVVALEEAERKQTQLAADEEKRLKKQTLAIEAYRRSLQQMLEDKQRAGQRAREGLGQTDSERELGGELNAEDDRYTNRVRDLNQQRLENPENAAAYEQQLRDEATYHTKMKDQIVSNYNQMKTAQQDWTTGVSAGLKQYAEDGQNYAGMAKEAVVNAFHNMEDALYDFVTTGKMSFASLTKAILSDLARIAIRIAASRALTAILGSFATSAAAPDAASMGSATAMDSGVMAAKGRAYDGGTQFFAKGGAFTNSIVSKPTSFSTKSSNNNIMGEAGPEAIMPLTRSSDGSLGVRASVDVSGLQQGGGSGVQVYITIDGNGNQQSNASDPGYASFGTEVGQFVDQRYRQLIAKDLQPGGDIWKAQQRG